MPLNDRGISDYLVSNAVFRLQESEKKVKLPPSFNSHVYRDDKQTNKQTNKYFIANHHCRQRAPVGNALSSSGTSQIGMFDIQATTKSKYYDHIVLLYLESRRCRYRSIIFACFYLYITVVIFIDYSDIDKMMDINNEKC